MNLWINSWIVTVRFFCSWRTLYSRGTTHVLWAMVQRSNHSTCGYHGWSPWRTCQSVSSFADITWGQTKNPFTIFSVIAVSACCALLFSPPLLFTVLQRREGSALFCWDFFVVRWLHYIGHVNFCPNSISSFWRVYWTVFARKTHSNFTIWKTVLSKRARLPFDQNMTMNYVLWISVRIVSFSMRSCRHVKFGWACGMLHGVLYSMIV